MVSDEPFSLPSLWLLFVIFFAFSLSFLLSDQTTVELQRYSFRLIADYLSEDTAKELSEILGLGEPEVQERSAELSGDDPPVECSNSSNSGKPKEDYYKSPTKEDKQAQVTSYFPDDLVIN